MQSVPPTGSGPSTAPSFEAVTLGLGFAPPTLPAATALQLKQSSAERVLSHGYSTVRVYHPKLHPQQWFSTRMWMCAAYEHRAGDATSNAAASASLDSELLSAAAAYPVIAALFDEQLALTKAEEKQLAHEDRALAQAMAASSLEASTQPQQPQQQKPASSAPAPVADAAPAQPPNKT